MKHWPPDRSTMQGSRFRRDPSVFRELTWGNASRSIPRISRDQRQMAAVGCVWLRSVTIPRRKISRDKRKSGAIFRNQAEGVGFEPTRTRQRPNGFQERPWFTSHLGCYLRFSVRKWLARHDQSRVYPALPFWGRLAGTAP